MVFFSETNQVTLPHRAPSCLWQGSWIHLCFFFFDGSKTYWMFGKMPPWAIITQDKKLFNCSSFRPANAKSCALGDSYRILPALMLSCEILRIYDNSLAVRLFHIIAIIFSLFYDHFCNYTSKKRDIKLK